MSQHHHHHHQPRSIKKMMRMVEEKLRRRGGRMTDVRRDVVAAMAGMAAPKTACQILTTINRRRKTQLSPVSLYRTLDFLMEIGVALKIESRNAYDLCDLDTPKHSHVLMVCDRCGDVEEVRDDGLTRSLIRAAQKHGHVLRHHAIELHGVCSDC